MPAQAARVLVVEDDQDTLEALCTYLESSFPQLRTVQASTGTAALAAVRSGGFDLIVCDYRIPGPNGLEVLRESALRFPSVPRILATAYPDLGIALSALHDVRVSRFLVKPVTPETVRSAVQELLAGAGLSGPAT